MLWKFALALAATLLMACSPQPVSTAQRSTKSSPAVLVIGDSMFASNRLVGKAVSDGIETLAQREVSDRSLPGASYFHALPISGSAGMRLGAQYDPGNWDWVVMNGGGNDILFGCGCGNCDRMLDRLISKDGQFGMIPATVRQARTYGAKVIYAGYLRTPGIIAPVESCGPIGDEMDRRLALMAKGQTDVWFLPMSDLVPHGDRSFHGLDLIHPSAKGSTAIAARIAAVINAH